MTVKQYARRVELARKYGCAELADGYELIRWSNGSWSVRHKDGSTLETDWYPERFEYLFVEEKK